MDTTFKLTPIQNQAAQLFLGHAREFLLVGGSRSGKSFVIVHQQLRMAQQYPGSRHIIARYRFSHAKNSIWLDTLKKVTRVCFPDEKFTWRNTDFYLQLENGSQLWIAGLDDKDRTEKILGMEFLTVFLNEASQISYEAYTTIKTRLAQKVDGAQPLLFVDANPPSKKHWMYRVFVEHTDPESNTNLLPTRYAMLKMNPDQNLENISTEYLDTLNSLPLRKRKRFRDGEFADDSEGALWTDDLLNGTRICRNPDGTLPVALKRIVIAIDPAVSSKDTSDETGIIVAGIGFDNHLYVIDDATGQYSPTEWARKAVALYNHYRADRIIGEVNNGGDLIEAVLRNVDAKISYRSVHATRDKLTRAEPIAAIYEQGKAHHINELLELELEMTTWEAQKGKRSPNRIDALVWAATDLCLRLGAISGQAKFHFRQKPNLKQSRLLQTGQKRLPTQNG
ncbi:PBSX family phage terminase large subunit [Mucilaginibacter gracilis]|uniref:PBSX family phage terminase large subunit n=1 Tax=Mucilaginibacter gracilis TaxID=423350 RepID=A0A495J920_9SPHI|nr:phage terminase large subunit [Mucilaginibacter gracilis]RKR84894.1 PBSX family phage terminase large subunit [Mucilaginibacter gracilis]